MVTQIGYHGHDLFGQVRSMTTDPQGNVYVGDDVNNRASANSRTSGPQLSRAGFTSTGTFLAQWGRPGTGPGQFTGAWLIATDGAGVFYVADANGHRVEKFCQSPVATTSTSWGRMRSLYRH